MLQETKNSLGKNEYKDGAFSAREWSAPTMVNPDEIKARIASFNLEGRRIKRMKMIGFSYFHTRDWIESHAYNALEHLSEEERQRQSNYSNIALDTMFGRCAVIDEPLLIEFEDGDVFEIVTPQQPEFRFSMNCIPWWIGAGTNLPNLDADIFFAPCLGRSIQKVEVLTYAADKDPICDDYFDETHNKRELVSDIVLRLDDGNGISIGPVMMDSCEVAFVDKNRQLLSLPFQELKPALFNWEDMHNDQMTGFEPEGSTIFFGEVGARHVDSPYITLASGDNGAELYITYTDFFLFELSITWLTKELFDEYGEYEFSASQWEAILEEAERIVSYLSFDDLFDDLTGYDSQFISGENVFQGLLNGKGANYWKNMDKYRIQLKDMREWTRRVLTEKDSMRIIGF